MELIRQRILIACIRNLGTCLCPRCLTPKNHVQQLATKEDMLQQKVLARAATAEWRAKIADTRKLIYKKNYAVDTAQVEALLKPESLVPTFVCLFFDQSQS
jgi:hypothetical protein